MIAPAVAGIVDPGPPKQVRLAGGKCAHIHSKSGAAVPHSKTQALDHAYQPRRRFGVRQCSAAFDASQTLMRNYGMPKVKWYLV
jgi:hypothetical protein